jgi:hypothetical protein
MNVYDVFLLLCVFSQTGEREAGELFNRLETRSAFGVRRSSRRRLPPPRAAAANTFDCDVISEASSLVAVKDESSPFRVKPLHYPSRHMTWLSPSPLVETTESRDPISHPTYDHVASLRYHRCLLEYYNCG